MNLEQLRTRMEEIQGSWNGDESGAGEERADIAGDIISKINVIEDLLKELDELN